MNAPPRDGRYSLGERCEANGKQQDGGTGKGAHSPFHARRLNPRAEQSDANHLASCRFALFVDHPARGKQQDGGTGKGAHSAFHARRLNPRAE
jgi:hypothetical protein